MSRDCCAALLCGDMGLSAVFVILVFPDDTHYFSENNVDPDQLAPQNPADQELHCC